MGRASGYVGDRLRGLGHPLRVADLRRMWLSDLLSVLGDHAAVIALAVLVYSRTHSAIWVAAVSAAAFAPSIAIGPLLATLADRWAYRPVMVGCDIIRAACYGLVLIPGLPAPILLALVFAAHCATFPFTAARAAQLPLIAADLYGKAQALSQSTLQFGALLGYAAGGVLLAVAGPRGAIVVNVASFVVSAVLVLRVKARVRTERDPSADPAGPQRSALNRMRSAMRTLRADPLLFWPALLVTVSVIGPTAAESMAVVVAHVVTGAQTSTLLIAVLVALPAIASLAATALAPTEGRPFQLVRISAAMALVSHGVAFIVLMSLHRGLVGGLAAGIAFTALGVSSAMTTPCVTVVGARLPADNRASVFALLEALLLAGQAVGALLGGIAVSLLGARNGLAVLLIPAVICCVIGIATLRRQQRVADASDEQVA